MLLLSRTTGPPTVTPSPAMAASTVTAVHSISIPPFYTYSAVYGTASCRASVQNRMASPLLTGPMLSRCKAGAGGRGGDTAVNAQMRPHRVRGAGEIIVQPVQRVHARAAAQHLEMQVRRRSSCRSRRCSR